ncbi:MAG: YdeI/OmpD-associated family protein [Rhodanobacter sp.]
MTRHDPRIDTYIAKSPAFAQPILEHLRSVVNAACPEVEEGIKWSMPFFSYNGSPLCMMAAFKQHCGFGFWLSRQVVGEASEDGMGQFGKLVSVADLPSKKQLADYVKKAMTLAQAGVKLRRPKPAAKPAPSLPAALAAEFAKKKHAIARKNYAAFSPGMQREYADWIDEAKTDATRQKRVGTALEWLAEGKTRNWKYAKC